MTARQTARTRLAATATAVLALVGLTGCERPAPIVTVVSGGTSVHTEAAVWCFEGQSAQAGDCARRAEGETVLPVSPGQRVGVDVSRPVVERGWFLELGDPAAQGQAQTSPVMEDEHYFAFTAPNIEPGSSLSLTVRTVGEDGNPANPTGEWRFTLVRR